MSAPDSKSNSQRCIWHAAPGPMAGFRQWWRNLGPWSSEHALGWGAATGILTGAIWFGVAYAINPNCEIGTFLFPVIFGAAVGFGYYLRARVDQSAF
jgi:hypothetical protein